MKIQYFEDTDTLYLEFQNLPGAETIEVNENMLADVTQDGKIIGVTLEHASEMNLNALEMIGFPMHVNAQR